MHAVWRHALILRLALHLRDLPHDYLSPFLHHDLTSIFLYLISDFVVICRTLLALCSIIFCFIDTLYGRTFRNTTYQAMPSREPSIDKRDFHDHRDSSRPLLSHNDSVESSHRSSQDNSYAGSFFEQVAEGIQAQDKKKMRREVIRWGSFAWAIINWYV